LAGSLGGMAILALFHQHRADFFLKKTQLISGRCRISIETNECKKAKCEHENLA
jgi:hypothetical protein